MKRTIPIVLTACALSMGLIGCSSTYKSPHVGDELVWTSDDEEERPMWTLTGEVEEDRSEKTVLFVGMSDRHSTQKGARDGAMSDARRQIANYAITEVEDVVKRMETGGNSQSGVQDPDVRLERITTEVSEHAISEMKAAEWRFEQWLDEESNRRFYQSFVRVSVPMASFDATNIRNVSEPLEDE